MERPAQDLEYQYSLHAGKGTLDDLLIESIDETLTDLLGRRGREAVYDHLVQNPFFPRREMARNRDALFDFLKTTFGKGGEVIGRTIIKKLYSKLQWEFVEIDDYGFDDYLQRIRARVARECIGLARANSIHSACIIPQRKERFKMAG